MKRFHPKTTLMICFYIIFMFVVVMLCLDNAEGSKGNVDLHLCNDVYSEMYETCTENYYNDYMCWIIIKNDFEKCFDVKVNRDD